MKKMMLAMLLVGVVFTNAQAKEPTIKETISFIQRVVNDDSLSSGYRFKTHLGNMTTLDIPIIKHFSGCKLIEIDYGYDAILDLAKLKVEFETEKSNRNSVKILFVDRKGYPSISYKINKKGKEQGKERKVNSKAHPLFYTFHGAYKKKMKKAFKHLVRKCHNKYGYKMAKDPF